MKELVSIDIGADGGKASASVDAGMIKVAVAYPVTKLLAPIKVVLIDKLKAAIPGTWDDAILDGVWADVEKYFAEV